MRSDQEFAAVYQRYYGEINRFIQARVHNADVAEELTGEVFYKAWRSRNSLQSGTFVRAWLYRIARNTLIDFWRKRKVEQLDDTELARIESGEPSLQSAIEEEDRRWELQKGLDQLAGKQKSVIVLRFIEGMNVRETAKVLELSEANVRTIQFRALGKLREVLPHETL